MTIDVPTEDIVTFAELARSVPKCRQGKTIHVSTVHRWRKRGLANGIRLEALKIGGAWVTSWQAFHRFCDRVTQANSTAGMTAEENTSQPSAAYQAADALLDEANW